MAVKVIPKAQHCGKPKELRRLRDEIRVLASLRHPNIMPMLCAYETGTHLLLVMERAHGGELFDRVVSHGAFTERDAATVMVGLLSALAHLHGHGVMHRDVKPENLLLLDPDGWQVKQRQRFGAVRTCVRARVRKRTRTSSLPSLAAARGTCFYFSGEA
jgi:serine/threonine protein kinase